MTKTQMIGATAAVVAGIALTAIVIVHLLSRPHDTPIVVGGGSIYGETYKDDSDGWGSHGSRSQSASLHAGGKNPFGIDLLTFENFDSNPGYAVTGTGGWAISIRNFRPQSQGDGVNPTPAVTFCSDANCSAAAPSCQASSFDKNSDVYFNVRGDGQIYTSLGGPHGSATQRVNFHDPTPGCDSPVANSCDKIYDVTLKTCKGGTLTLNCSQQPSRCRVTIGVAP